MINYWRVSVVKNNQKLQLLSKNNDEKIISLLTSNFIAKREISKSKGTNIINSEINNDIFDGKVLAILLSEFRCFECQLKELDRLNSMKDELNSFDINIVGISIESEKGSLIIQKKISKIEFPITSVQNDKLKKEGSSSANIFS